MQLNRKKSRIILNNDLEIKLAYKGYWKFINATGMKSCDQQINCSLSKNKLQSKVFKLIRLITNVQP